jgi:hypothetical protein
VPPRDAGRDGSGKPIGALRMVSLEGTLDGRRVRIARLDVPIIVRGSGGAGQAGELVAAALEEARVGGHSLALALTSESGGAGALDGFQPLPCSEAACRTVLPVPWPKEPEWLKAGGDPLRFVPGLRSWRRDDLDEVAAIHAETIARQRLRIDRDPETWEQIVPAQDAPFFVIDRSGRVDAYVLLGAGRPTVRWREHGARRGAEDLLVDLFWSALAWARGARLQRIEGWCMPGILTVQPLYPTSDRSRKGRVPMLRTLDPKTPLPEFKSEDECRLWELDAI